MSRSNLHAELINLQRFLQNAFPGALIMPAVPGEKRPMLQHKDNAYTLGDAYKKGIPLCTVSGGVLVLLPKQLIVVDVDDHDLARDWEQRVASFGTTVACKTGKGMHFYFRRTTACDDVEMMDGARQLKAADGTEIPIDIKTITKPGTKGAISIPPSCNKEWQRTLGSYEVLDMPAEFVEFFQQHKKTRHFSSAASSTAGTPPDHNTPSVVALPAACAEEARQLLQILSHSRADNFPEWIQLGWCLHNISASALLQDWIAFSRNSSKFHEGECEQKWSHMRSNGLSMGTLHMWAREDDNDGYKQLMSESVFPLIKKSNGKHQSIAVVAHILLKSRYVCVSSDGKYWYRFTGTLWEQDGNAVYLRQELCKTVRQQFELAESRIANTAPVNESQLKIQKRQLEVIGRIILQLDDHNFKKSVEGEMRVFFLDTKFLSHLDANPALLAFTNGVFDLRQGIFRAALPDDRLSLSVGYPFVEKVESVLKARVVEYFEKLHHNTEQRVYMLKTLARQLYGDTGMELFHIHAGVQGSGSNGKTRWFQVLESVLGDYIQKFKIELLVAKQRGAAHKPDPETGSWRGRRLLYTTEPNSEDKLHSGILKEMTGGEKMVYRLLFSNSMQEFMPQFKLHLMCNMPPQVDGGDQGVQRRMRMLTYESRFVPAAEANPRQHKYVADPMFLEAIQNNDGVKMEFLRYILDHFDIAFDYTMPHVVEKSSALYLAENDTIMQFIKAHVKKAEDGDEVSFFKLSDARVAFASSKFASDTKLATLKLELQRHLLTPCLADKKINGVKHRNVFMNWMLVPDMEEFGDTGCAEMSCELGVFK